MVQVRAVVGPVADCVSVPLRACMGRTLRTAASARAVGPRGIRVNTISPGPVSTGLWLGDDGVAATVARAAGSQADAVAKQAASQSVTARFTTPQEVADLVLLLASDRAGNVTGADFLIDGGLITTL